MFYLKKKKVCSQIENLGEKSGGNTRVEGFPGFCFKYKEQFLINGQEEPMKKGGLFFLRNV